MDNVIYKDNAVCFPENILHQYCFEFLLQPSLENMKTIHVQTFVEASKCIKGEGKGREGKGGVKCVNIGTLISSFPGAAANNKEFLVYVYHFLHVLLI